MAELLTNNGMLEFKASDSSMSSGAILSSYQGVPLLMRDLQYCTLIRSDITFSVNKICQFITTPINTHWQATKMLLRYIKGFQHCRVATMKSDSFNLIGFCDFNWTSCPNDRKSTYDQCVFSLVII